MGAGVGLGTGAGGVGAGVGVGLGGGTGVGLGVGGGMGAGAGVAAVCCTPKGNPAIVSVPLRSPAGFASATKAALPLPVTSELTMRNQATSLDALHLHPGIVETETVKEPPSGEIRKKELPSSKRHGAASCDTATRLPFTTRAEDRTIAAGFSATTTLTDASPWPASGVTCIHGASLSIVH